MSWAVTRGPSATGVRVSAVGAGRFEGRRSQQVVDRRRLGSSFPRIRRPGERRELDGADALDQAVEVLADARLGPRAVGRFSRTSSARSNSVRAARGGRAEVRAGRPRNGCSKRRSARLTGSRRLGRRRQAPAGERSTTRWGACRRRTVAMRAAQAPVRAGLRRRRERRSVADEMRTQHQAVQPSIPLRSRVNT